MNTTKLQDAVFDLKQKKEVLERAIKSLESAMACLNGNEPSIVAESLVVDTSMSYVDLVVGFLEQAERPATIHRIVDHIRGARGNPTIKRSSVEGTLSAHIARKGKEARILRMSPGVYGLPPRPPAHTAPERFPLTNNERS